MGITVDINDRPVLDYLNQLLAKSSNLQPLMDAIGQAMESRVSSRFETRTDPLGRPWAPWARSTIKSYPEDGHGFLLDRYGDMLHSLSHSAFAASVTIGFGQPHAAYHEFGTRRMPRRGLLTADPDSGTLGPEDAESILDIVRGYLGES
jgi:phage virion morphogenesis protein